ncbi:ATP-binding cassette domain-containing protein [Myceligenerans pegani]|uniref:Branched-chain amino acid ABC transporter ATP-binding protein/permease n=1 Tax=Myceligenerans pegani TaxID=2776917 RepID=A0ABR9N3S0_9MICO|nr:branched-chain amino acid ABC transporter ATP-binding protein/permease [Myceligenerans sp. TRM 65318]MBE1877748.1 branched-chain amino acid ABC transporter ATP-binding protein/permease [Myceligenerans sp. TRM 65318]MBE3020019.1 branched-chain amino acid ABC transporter ATP-binding protein/permease [Myceligenerans sp. TRM 65318]
MFTDSTLLFVALSGIFAFSFYAVLVAGQLSLGQAGFAALAAYTSAVLAPDPAEAGDAVTLAVALGTGVVVGAVAAVLLGLPTMRLRGVFLAIATLGFAEAVRILLVNAEWTGGAQGMSVPKIVTPGVAWVLLAVVAYLFWRQGPTRYGRALAAIREDELAARATGIDVGAHRLAAFVTAGAVSGAYGALLAFTMRFIDPGLFDFASAIDGLVMAVVGGSTVWFGPVLGGAFLTLVPELQRAVGLEAGWIRPFLAGLLLLAVILFRPGGLASFFPAGRGTRPLSRVQASGARGDTAADDGPGAPGGSGADTNPAGANLAGTVQASVQPHRRRAQVGAGDVVARLAGVSKDYGGVHALRGVDLELRAGEIVGLIGPNGAGKTTCVNILSGLVPPSGGAVEVLGIDPVRTPVHRVAAAGVARTFQHAKLFGRLSVLDNVLAGAHLVTRGTFLRRLLWLPSARWDERAAVVHATACLERVGIADKAGLAAGELSYGDQRRVEIARALAADPALLILDEPAAGMNRVEAAALGDLITSLASDGLTILLIEHDVGLVMRTCDRITVLDFGAVIASGDPAHVRDHPDVVTAYLGTEAD